MRWPLLAAFVLCAAVATAAAQAPVREARRIIGSGIPPLSFMRDGVVTGYCVEVIREVQRRVGDATPIELIPWTRAYRMGIDGANVMLICPKRTPEREPHFKWAGPVLESESMFYALRRSHVRLSSLAGRRPVMVLDREQLPALMAQAGADPAQVEPVLKLMSIQSFFTFPLYAPDSEVAQWQLALDKMKRDGTLARLQKQWFAHR